METDAHRKLGEDRMSDCRSFGSNYHPCSQSRKISIGVMVDSVPKTRSGAAKEDEVAVPNAEKITSNKENSLEGKREGQGVRATIIVKQTEAQVQKGSPWISTRSKTPTLETVHNAKQPSSFPASSGRRDKFNETSILRSDNGKQKKFDPVTYKRKGGNETVERVEEFSFATAQEIPGLDKAVTEDKTNKTENRSNESLKMKLWEILGSVSSPNKQFSNSQTLEVGANKLKQEQICDKKGDTVVKHRQNSDTIETDSESPDHTTRRPVTRSLTRKKAPTEVRQSKIKDGPSSSYKQKHQEKGTFSFEEGWSGRLHGAVNGGSFMSKTKKSEKKRCEIEPRKIYFLEKDNADNIQQANAGSKTPPPAEKTLSLGRRMGGVHNFAHQKNRDYEKPKTGIQEKDSHQSPVAKKTDQLGDFYSPAAPENVEQQEDFVNPSLKNILDPQQQDDFQSPSLGMKTPSKKGSSPNSVPKTDQAEIGVGSPPSAEIRFTVGDIYSFKTWRISKPDCSGSSAQTESSVSLITLWVCFSWLLLKQVKLTYLVYNILLDYNPSKRNLDGLTGLISCNQLGLSLCLPVALERLEGKMKSVTRKKSSEILVSAAEGINLQFQNVESQIQTDVRKLTSLSKSKRKRLETRFQEQQEQLKVIHEKFKEEVNRYLQNCRSTLEGLEANQIEFKGTIERQKASHRKLLLQVEETIETQLNDAQRRITTVQKASFVLLCI
ncbi:hypothetical protein L1049_005388 [Liquidambar formosana]|uniref:Meiosis-specific protein ASY3-like coiled-coil domain-containing protein n=1 Tax=Liquidambar formosana TaxID=63359 RepID=A0AAP0RV79_LIQFO